MHLTITTPDKKLFEGSVQRVTLPGSAGSFQVLKDHAPLVSSLQAGVLSYECGGHGHTLTIETGWVKVLHNKITVLLESDPPDV